MFFSRNAVAVKILRDGPKKENEFIEYYFILLLLLGFSLGEITLLLHLSTLLVALWEIQASLAYWALLQSF